MIVHLLLFGVVMYFILKWINTKFPEPPEDSDAAFLAMCCRRSGKNINEVFKEAALSQGFNITDELLAKDIKIFLHGETEVPFYVREFIKEGRLYMEENK